MISIHCNKPDLKSPYQVCQGEEIHQALSFNDLDMSGIGGELSKSRVHPYPMAIYPALGPGVVKKSSVIFGINQPVGFSSSKSLTKDFFR